MGFYREAPVPVAVHTIIMEASSAQDKAYMRQMSKDDIHEINGTLVQNLYGSVLERKQCDFGDIPKSQGDIEKVKYYNSTMECLDILTELLNANNMVEPGLSDVKNAISNVKMLKPQFTLGFQSKHDYIILLYNTTVMAIIDATSMLIAEYMNFIVGPNEQGEIKLTGKTDKSRGIVSLDNLRQFNTLVSSGSMDKAMTYMFNEQKSNFIETGVVATGAVVIALLAIVPVTRELIYFYASSRLKLSDYLEMQASFLEMNKMVIDNSKQPPQKKKEIIKKQEKVILKMRRLSDKLKINNEDIGDIARKEIQKENSGYDLDSIEKSLASNKMNGNTTRFV